MKEDQYINYKLTEFYRFFFPTQHRKQKEFEATLQTQGKEVVHTSSLSFTF